MDNQVEEVKQKTDIVSLISERIEVKKAGRNFKALCPFHSEKTPSFMISPELQIYKCFGCGAGGDVFAFLKEYEGMEFGEALRYLAEKAGVKLAPYRQQEGGERERLIEIHNWTSKFYHYFLTKHPVGRQAWLYLTKERGLKPSTIEEFQLGFSPDNPIILKRFLIEKKKFTPNEVQDAGIGIIKGSSFYDRFRGRVIFPLFDHRGNIVGFAGRIMPAEKNPDMAKYINSPETAIYHKSNLLYGLNLTRQFIKRKGTAIVVEGELDAISSWQMGVKNVAAVKGTALTDDQIRLLSRLARKVILALDTDLAGDAAARRGITLAHGAGLEVKVARFGKYKDPDEAAQKNPEEYKQALIKAAGVWDYLVDSTFGKHKESTSEGKAAISREIIPILSEIPDKILQAYYVDVVAKRLGVPTEAVSQELTEFSGKEKKEEPKIEIGQKPKTKERQELLEERLLGLAFELDPETLKQKEMIDLISTPLAKRILEEYLTFSKKRKIFNSSEFAEGLPKELFDGFAEMVLKSSNLEDPKELEKELKVVKRELKILKYKYLLTSLAKEIKTCEEKGTKKKLLLSQKRFNQTTQKLSQLEEEAEEGIILSEKK
jgi:DNA primase